jgi:hypothetical protein
MAHFDNSGEPEVLAETRQRPKKVRAEVGLMVR